MALFKAVIFYIQAVFVIRFCSVDVLSQHKVLHKFLDINYQLWPYTKQATDRSIVMDLY